MGKKKTTNSRSNGQSARGAIPRSAAVRLYTRTELGADPVPLQGMAEYKRKDETEVIIPETSILTELNDAGALNTRRCYMLNWLVPDEENDRGSLLQLGVVNVEIHNEGIFDVNIVAQQPHGYESCPTSIAAWVLLANKTVKAGATVSLTVHPVDNNFVVPLRTDVNGADCVTFVAFSAARQAMSAGGSAVAKQEVGIRIKAVVHYVASGNALQGGKFFALRSIEGDSEMFLVDKKPPVPIAINDVSPGKSTITLKWGASEGGYMVPTFVNANGHFIDPKDFTGISTNHSYRLPACVFAMTNDGKTMQPLLYIRWLKANSGGETNVAGWFVVKAPDDATPSKAGRGDYYSPKPSQNVTFSGDSLLIPTQKKSWARIKTSARRFSSLPLTLPENGSGLRSGPLGGWRDDLLTAVSFIVGVVKVAAAVAGAAGLLNVVNDNDDAMSGCSFERVGV